MARFCENCGTVIPDGAVFCVGCGKPVPKQASPNPQPIPQQAAPIPQPIPQQVPQQAAPNPQPIPQQTASNSWQAPQQAASNPRPAPQQAAPAQQTRCARCGAPLDPGEAFCSECGLPVRQQSAPPQSPAGAQQPAYGRQQPANDRQSLSAQWPVQQKKKGKGLLIGLIAGGAALLIALVLVGGFVWPGFFKSDDAKPTGEDTVYTPIQKPGEKPVKPTKPTEPNATEPGETEPAETQPTEFENPFEDMEEDDYAYDAFAWAYQNGIVSGTKAHPEDEITRAEAVTFLWRCHGSPEPAAEDPFTDLDEDKYYYEPAIWAYENGIVTPSSKGEFKPGDTLTRAQALTFLHRDAGGPGSSGRQYFADTPLDRWFSEPIAWGVENGVLDVYNWDFYPNDATWREDFMLWLARAMGADVDEALVEEPYDPGFEDYEASPNLFVGNSVIFHSVRSREDDTQTTLIAKVISYDVFTEADGYPTPPEGCEYRRLRLRIDGADDSADYGNYVSWNFIDYYHPDLLAFHTETDDENGVMSSKVYWNDKFYDVSFWRSNDELTGDLSDAKYAMTAFATVPKGYDGLCFYVINGGMNGYELLSNYDEFSDDNCMIFRMD